ncbi:MAG: xanthine dehydrogenase small subunit, partial [Pseudomonadota bacterium]|nr:xanthine dehydrogenase small subunit [Pseudomonadota bacterium]
MRDRITFVLNNEVEQVSGLAGDTTLLNWLRQTKRLTGSKEGCGEGDCGACTVVIARRQADGSVRWHPVNACIQFMGMLEGAAVTTIEGLQNAGAGSAGLPPDALHPCQQVMVDHHGSQCGFCTPGFVMSLFAAWCNGDGLAKPNIDTTLAGNLCRCTGYQPIVDAAAALETRSIPPDFERQRRETEASLMAAITHDETVCLSDGHRSFTAPTSIEGFVQSYAQMPDATIVSGATDVGLWVTKQNRHLPNMIWTGRVKGFDKVERRGAHWRIGPAVTHAAAMATLADGRPDLGEVMRRFGSVQVRASGTVCGNIANGSPIGDLSPMLIALAAEVELAGPASNRRLPLESFFIDYGRQDREADEFVSAILVPVTPTPLFRAYKISKRFDQDISAVLGAFSLTVSGRRITSARLAFGGMAATPVRAAAAEAVLTGAALEISAVKAAAAGLAEAFTPISDMRASADYRH